MFPFLNRTLHYLNLTRGHGILRRYFFTNGYDGALAMLGLNVGFYSGGGVATSTALSACLGTAIALGISGATSAYISETEERKKELNDLESALVSDLSETDHAQAARWVPILTGAVNGLSPFLIALVITLPYFLDLKGVALPLTPLEASIGVALAVIFVMGILLGKVSGSFWLWTGLRALLIACITSLLILLFQV